MNPRTCFPLCLFIMNAHKCASLSLCCISCWNVTGQQPLHLHYFFFFLLHFHSANPRRPPEILPGLKYQRGNSVLSWIKQDYWNPSFAMENRRRAGIFPGVKMVNLPLFLWCSLPVWGLIGYSPGKRKLNRSSVCLCFSNVPVYQ